jgi:phosphate starvation-inducible PhoH-like protein
MATITLQYANAREVQQLFDNNPSNLRLVQEQIGVTITARDGWIKLEGNEATLEQAKEILDSLRALLNSGQPPHQQDIIKAIETVQDSGSDALKSISSVRITTSPRKPQITPKTLGQKEYIQSIENHDVTFGIGPAGTGKTYLAMALAVSALYRGDVSRIVLTRPAVEAGEALGFLPGDLREKLSPYLRPLHDALLDMMPVEEVQKYMERETIEIAPLAYMRGRTLNNAFVILDESQNTTNEQMFMFLTRLGFHSKAVITGDPTQIDLQPSKQSGLIEAIETLKKTDGIAINRFTQKDVVRHPLVKKIISAYETQRSQA